MTVPIYAKLEQTAVYWPREGSDGYGEPLYGSPIEVQSRWEDVSERYLDANGEERVSRSKIFVDQNVVETGMMFLGTLAEAPADPKDDNECWEIKRVERIPNLRADRTVWLAVI